MDKGKKLSWRVEMLQRISLQIKIFVGFQVYAELTKSFKSCSDNQ